MELAEKSRKLAGSFFRSLLETAGRYIFILPVGRMRKIFFCTLFVLPLFAAGKSETFSGTILSTEEDFCGKSVDYVLQASLATESSGNLVLVLAPKWYMVRLKMEIRIGDKVEATVLRQSDGKFHVLTMKVGGKTFRLRDAKGVPLWKPEPGSEDLFKSICKA